MMWETFIKIGLPNRISFEHLFDMIRFNVYATISSLKNNDVLSWYCFLIHGKNGVPTSEEDNNLYFHIRFTTKKEVKLEDIRNLLPDYCVLTRKIKREDIAKISMGAGKYIDESLFKSGVIEEAWRILGEQSEWVIDMLNAHKTDVKIPPDHVRQFLHYYFNMLQVFIDEKCPKCGSAFSIRM